MSRMFAAIHASRRKVDGLGEEDSWRDFLAATTGKRSLRAMDGRELGRVLDALHDRGAPGGFERVGGRVRLADSPQARRARALWIDLHELAQIDDPSEKALGHFVKRQTGRDALRFCTAADMGKVIEALDSWCRRAGLDASDERVRVVAAGILDQPDWRQRAFNALLMRAQWDALIALGVMKTGLHAKLITWCANKGHHCQHPVFLAAGEQRHCIRELGKWLRRAKSENRHG